MKQKRIVITGVGLVSPIGSDLDIVWDALINGHSGINRITSIDTSSFPSQIGGEVKDFNPSGILSSKEIYRFDRFVQYGVVAAEYALQDAGLLFESEISVDKSRVGVCVGSGIGGIHSLQKNAEKLFVGPSAKVSPFFIPGATLSMVAGVISIRYGFQGPVYAISAACATSAQAIITATHLLKCGEADVVVAGGTESAICELGLSGFFSMHALSCRNDSPQQASRPWDKGRDGFLLSDGAAIVILETHEHAIQRGAPICAEVVGVGMTGDASHITLPLEDGSMQAQAMRLALKSGGYSPKNVNYINAHGTSTLIGDRTEARAIESVFGDTVPVSSTKSVTGHLIGGAGSAEVIFSILSMRHGILPPTINLDDPEEGIHLDLISHSPRFISSVDCVLSNSFGFGGSNVSLLLSQI